MDCLKGYIGVSSSIAVCESGLYVDALPDISVANLERLVIDEGGVSELWTEIENRALAKFRTLFIREYVRCHKVSSVEVCDYLICANRAVLATALWYLLGAEVMYERSVSSRMNTYTTIDRGKAKEMNEYFLHQCDVELGIAVNAIDTHASGCDADTIEPRDYISFAKPII